MKAPIYRVRERQANDAFAAYKALVLMEVRSPELAENPVWTAARRAAFAQFLARLRWWGVSRNELGAETQAAPAIANLEAEAALIGACLMENALVDPLSAMVGIDDFAAAGHANVWAAILAEQAKGARSTP
jgi:hypothetical protein